MASLLLPAGGWAGPVLPCPDGPDPLVFRPERPISGASVSPLVTPCLGPEIACPGPVALAATVDKSTGIEWVAVAWRSPTEALMVAVSSDGGVSFAALEATVADPGPVEGRPAVALRVDDGAVRLGVAWCAEPAGELRVRLTDVLDGSFGGAAVIGEPPLDSGAALAITPGPAPALFVVAAHDSVLGEQVVATSGGSRDPADWSAAQAVHSSARARLSLSADAAGAGGGGGLTLAIIDASQMVAVLRSDDAGANWSPPTVLGDSSRSAWAPVLHSAPDPVAADSAWTVLGLREQRIGGPRTPLVTGDAGSWAAGLLDHDFDAGAGPAPVMLDPAAELPALHAAAAATDALAYFAWESAGELVFVRRLLARARPVLSGGCGQRLTGLDPVRGAGTAAAPSAGSLGRDLVIAFVDDRSGAPEVWIKRSDSTPPAPADLVPTPSDCGDVPAVALAWDPPEADVVSQVLEVGSAPGGTDFTRDAGLGDALLVEGLAPATTYYFRLRVVDAAGHEVVSDEVSADTPSCAEALLIATVLAITDDCSFGGAGGDGVLDPGETATLRVRVENFGTAPAPGVGIRLLSRTPGLFVRSGGFGLGDMDVGAFGQVSIEVDLSATVACGDRVEVLARTISDGTRWGQLVDLSPPAACTPCVSAACTVTADASRTAPVVICDGEDATLDAGASTSSDCAGVVLHEWFDGGAFVGAGTVQTVSPRNTNVYRLVSRCSTDLSCSDEDTVEIVVNPRPSVNISEDPPPPHCAGDTVTLTASTSDPAAVFSWDTGEGTAAIDVTAGGLYRVTVTDSNACVRGVTHRVDLGPAPSAEAGDDSLDSCDRVLIGTPGFPLLDYSWEPPDGLEDPTAAQTWAMPAAATLYTLTVTDPLSGCFAVDDVEVGIRPSLERASGLRLNKLPGDVAATWDVPMGRPARIYSETDETLARSASAASPSAALVCEGTDGCSFAPATETLIFYQAVSVCEDGLSEGPN